MSFIRLKDRIFNEKRQMSNLSEKIKVTDEELMLNVLQGDKKSFYTLVNRWNKPIINFFYRGVSNQETAEDLAQELFLNVWKTKNYSPKAPFYSWLYKIANNKLVDHYRKNKIEVVSIENNPEVINLNSDDYQKNQEKMIADEEEGLVIKAMQQLNDDQRTILLMSKYQKLAYNDIAKILNCSTETVKVRVFRALKSFIGKFKELDQDE
ncbi:MAG: RNA polymerase sigma factor [Candidatus Sericytochromatia bacterium]|nr:RNA polymerase sigma factor [Candidatus Sericytochromatia bacterium]